MEKNFKFFMMAFLIILLFVPPAFAAAPKAEPPKYRGTLTFMESIMGNSGPANNDPVRSGPGSGSIRN